MRADRKAKRQLGFYLHRFSSQRCCPGVGPHHPLAVPGRGAGLVRGQRLHAQLQKLQARYRRGFRPLLGARETLWSDYAVLRQ